MSSLSCWGPVVIYHLWEGGDGEFGGITFFRGTKGDESSPFR